MNKEELLKEIMKLPKIETDNPISTMNGINVEFTQYLTYKDVFQKYKEK